MGNKLIFFRVPSFVRDKRFANWLRDARDWAISRNRFWGTPINLWTSDDFAEIICPSSIAELEELTGVKITDLHREKYLFKNITKIYEYLLTLTALTIWKSHRKRAEENWNEWVKYSTAGLNRARCLMPNNITHSRMPKFLRTISRQILSQKVHIYEQLLLSNIYIIYL